MSRPRARSGVLLGVAALAFLAAPSRADFFEHYGTGPRGSSLAAATAEPDVEAAVYYNPGALALANRGAFALGYQYLFHDLSMDSGSPTADARAEGGVDDYAGISVGVVRPIRFGRRAEGLDFECPRCGTTVGRTTRRCPVPACGTDFEVLRPARGVDPGAPAPAGEEPPAAPLTVGLLFFTPNEPVVGVSSRGAEQPQFVTYESGVQRLGFLFALGWRARETLGVGAGLSVLADSSVKTVTRTVGSDVKVDFFQDLSAAWAPNAGVGWRPGPGLSLGAAYRGELSLKVEGTTLTNALGFDLDLDVESITLFTPQQAALGVAWEASPRLSALADWTWYDWSAYPGAGTAVLPTSGASATLLSASTVPRPGFRDIHVPRLGLEWRPSIPWALRAGGYHRPSPVPEQRGTSSLIDLDKDVIAAGVGRRWEGGVGLDLYGQLHMLEGQSVRKSPPATGGYQARGTIAVVGLSFSYRY
ncbi:MAG: outer membrane protein transport protein [Planctomycetes bacterium]|nr:outer membrane protein transport protein [Planctomycetota bacterium]